MTWSMLQIHRVLRKYMTRQKSSKSLDFFGDDFPRLPIPVGCGYQAGDANSDKWLGTYIWPIKDRNARTRREFIGKGRPSSCSCNSPRSMYCMNLHICQNRLQHDLGYAFLDWKFDEMGEEVSKSWTNLSRNVLSY
ncbi:At-rich interactive domain-containing protein 2-like [Thalictrum thalictroides]|uniref:At-rich interactive domain-containing protein 2-like n=1 Tax=Thalictrum thalictroides TaxID=46969 RepID=A0A7J6VIC5_THATH|nr:At-rich interactive domain-containing protein 2-like [Thalictrum thalictroides]